jgi:hypothetical protein
MMDDTRILTNGNLCQITYDDVIRACDGEHFTMTLVDKAEIEAVIAAVNIGIDSRLQACYVPDRGDSYGDGERSITATSDTQHWKTGDKIVLARTLDCVISPESLPVLLRRLFDDVEGGESLADSILDSLGFDDCGKLVADDGGF